MLRVKDKRAHYTIIQAATLSQVRADQNIAANATDTSLGFLHSQTMK